MRHGKKFNHLGRTKPHRKAMLSNMACSLIEHKRINTTVAKAKALRTFIEPLITRSKTDSTHSRRMVFRQLNNKTAVVHLFRDVAPKVADRPGGYTRIIRTGFRLGDNAEMCMIELVDFNDLYTKEQKSGKRRRRKKSKSKGTAPAAAADTAPQTTSETVETPEAEVKEAAKPAATPENEPKAETGKEAEKKDNGDADKEDNKDQ